MLYAMLFSWKPGLSREQVDGALMRRVHMGGQQWWR